MSLKISGSSGIMNFLEATPRALSPIDSSIVRQTQEISVFLRKTFFDNCHSFFLYFPSDGTSRIKIPPGWEEEDRILAVQGRIGEDIVVELKLRSTDDTDDVQLEL